MIKENYILKILNAGVNEAAKRGYESSHHDPNKTQELSSISILLLELYKNNDKINEDIIDRLEGIKDYGSLHNEVYLIAKEMIERKS